MMYKKKLLIFHPALAPYRVDFFNSLSRKFNASFYFNFTNVTEQKFNQDILRSKCLFKINYLTRGFEFLDRSFRFGILKIIKIENPSIIICSEFGAITMITYLYKKLFNKQYKIYTMSDDSVDTFLNRRFFAAHIRSLIAKNIDGVIFPSQQVCDWFNLEFSGQIKTLLLPVIHEDNIFRAALEDSLSVARDYYYNKKLKGKKLILYIGRLVPVKNLFFLLKTIAKVRGNNFYMVFVGDGYLKSELQELTVDLNLNNKVLFEGRKEGAELLAWYNLAHIFVLPSYNEKFGAVVNEALLAGCNVLCSDKAGASSLINSTNGHVFDPTNEEELLFLINDELKLGTSVIKNEIKLRKTKMPFTFSSFIDTILMQLDKG